MKLLIPEFSLVVLIGASGAGKSTFARRHFKPTEVLSSDFCRGLVADDESDQSATRDAFDILHTIAVRRLARRRLTVIDATNVQAEARKPLLDLARQYHCLAVAIVFHLPERLSHERNARRPDRAFGPHVVRRQLHDLRRSLPDLRAEGFHHVYVFTTPEEVEAAVVERQPLRCDRSQDHGPFDIIGDVHGCFDELRALLERLGYVVEEVAGADGVEYVVTPPPGRKVVFPGDLVDRGPNSPGVLRLAMGMVEAGTALCLPGNHDDKLLRKLKGREVQIRHGLAETLAQLGREPPAFVERVRAFLEGLVSHYVLDDWRLVVAHAGMKEELQGRVSRQVRDFALYGETTGETDEFGLPVRYNWAAEYRGRAKVVYGHTPVPEPEWLNHTINIDTGCVFGGKLTALRYPELDLVSVPAARVYAPSARPFPTGSEGGNSPAASARPGGLLDIEDVAGRRIISTRLLGNVTIREEHASAALEVMGRFAANPRWLIYLPPTMSPPETSRTPGLLEHPAEVFAYYRHQGVPRVVAEAKHMGSRTVLVVCRDEEVARRRFGVEGEGSGICYTRSGRRCFDDRALEEELLARVRAALDACYFWEEYETDWVCLDCELLPWSARAQSLLRRQYAAVGAAGQAALAAAEATLARGAARGADVAALQERYRERAALLRRFVDAYRRYCWPVQSLADLRLAPFHLLASEQAVHLDWDHVRQMELFARLSRIDPGLLLATPYTVVDLTDPQSEAAGVRWWEELVEGGAEGMVVKPVEVVARGRRGLVQPAMKCRAREYLRIIYGPEYTLPQHLERLRSRAVGAKRSLALREFALGIEALERFVRREPLYRVHECVFGVLALESEPVDPRL